MLHCGKPNRQRGPESVEGCAHDGDQEGVQQESSQALRAQEGTRGSGASTGASRDVEPAEPVPGGPVPGGPVPGGAVSGGGDVILVREAGVAEAQAQAGPSTAVQAQASLGCCGNTEEATMNGAAGSRKMMPQPSP